MFYKCFRVFTPIVFLLVFNFTYASSKLDDPVIAPNVPGPISGPHLIKARVIAQFSNKPTDNISATLFSNRSIFAVIDDFKDTSLKSIFGAKYDDNVTAISGILDLRGVDATM